MTPNKPKKPQVRGKAGTSRETGVMAKKSGNTAKYLDYRYIVGVDTGVNVGWAVWDRYERRFRVIETTKIHNAMLTAMDKVFENRAFFRVEDARKATFGRNNKADMHKAQGAGSVKRDASIWEDFLEDYGIPYEMVRPAMRKKKITAAEFEKITGWTGRTSQHARDAAMLVYGL